MLAIEKFDHTKGYKLSTYATWWIEQKIRRNVKKNNKPIKSSLKIQNDINKINNIKDFLRGKLQRNPTTEELSEELCMPEKRINFLLTLSKDIKSLDDKIGEDKKSSLIDLIGDGYNLIDFILKKDLEEDIEILIKNLTKREAFIIKLRFGLIDDIPKTFDEISRNLNISRERCRQINNVAIKKLKFIASEKMLIN